MNEAALSHHIQLQASDHGTTLFRNQTGRYELKDGRWLVSGLCVGGSDLIGWKSVEITADMVGKRMAIFAAVEVKSPTATGNKKQPTVEQDRFLKAVQSAGGVAFCTNNLEEAMRLLTGSR
jgi:hypothetical protein